MSSTALLDADSPTHHVSTTRQYEEKNQRGREREEGKEGGKERNGMGRGGGKQVDGTCGDNGEPRHESLILSPSNYQDDKRETAVSLDNNNNYIRLNFYASNRQKVQHLIDKFESSRDKNLTSLSLAYPGTCFTADSNKNTPAEDTPTSNIKSKNKSQKVKSPFEKSPAPSSQVSQLIFNKTMSLHNSTEQWKKKKSHNSDLPRNITNISQRLDKLIGKQTKGVSPLDHQWSTSMKASKDTTPTRNEATLSRFATFARSPKSPSTTFSTPLHSPNTALKDSSVHELKTVTETYKTGLNSENLSSLKNIRHTNLQLAKDVHNVKHHCAEHLSTKSQATLDGDQVTKSANGVHQLSSHKESLDTLTETTTARIHLKRDQHLKLQVHLKQPPSSPSPPPSSGRSPALSASPTGSKQGIYSKYVSSTPSQLSPPRSLRIKSTLASVALSNPSPTGPSISQSSCTYSTSHSFDRSEPQSASSTGAPRTCLSRRMAFKVTQGSSSDSQRSTYRSSHIDSPNKARFSRDESDEGFRNPLLTDTKSERVYHGKNILDAQLSFLHEDLQRLDEECDPPTKESSEQKPGVHGSTIKRPSSSVRRHRNCRHNNEKSLTLTLNNQLYNTINSASSSSSSSSFYTPPVDDEEENKDNDCANVANTCVREGKHEEG